MTIAKSVSGLIFKDSTGKIIRVVSDFPEWENNGDFSNEFLLASRIVRGNNVRYFSDTTNLFGSLSGSNKWYGGVLAPNGKIYGIPFGSTQVLEIDPVTNTTNLFGSLSSAIKWQGGVLAPNGKIYGIPSETAQVLEIDPVTNTTTLFGSLSGSGKWVGGVLAANGKIYGIPHNSTQVLEIGGNSSAFSMDFPLSRYVNKL